MSTCFYGEEDVTMPINPQKRKLGIYLVLISFSPLWKRAAAVLFLFLRKREWEERGVPFPFSNASMVKVKLSLTRSDHCNVEDEKFRRIG